MVSVSAACFEHSGLWKLLDARELLKSTETGIELFPDVMGFGGNGHLKKLLAGLEVGMHCPCKDVDLLAGEGSAALRHAFDRMESVLQSCEELGAPYMVLHTNPTALPIAGDPAALRERGIARIREVAALAARHSVKIWIENVGFVHRGNMLFDQERYLDIFRLVPEADALIDTGHAHMNGWNIPDTIRALGPRLAGMHVSDNFGGRDLHIRMGSGNIDFGAVKQAVGALKHRPRLIVEYLPPSCDSLDAILEDCAALQAWLPRRSHAD